MYRRINSFNNKSFVSAIVAVVRRNFVTPPPQRHSSRSFVPLISVFDIRHFTWLLFDPVWELSQRWLIAGQEP